MTHTPGPWGAVPSTPADGFECWYIVGNRDAHNGEKEIAVVNGPQSGTQAANAHLITAAPDLLAVLRRIRDSYPGYIPDFIEAANAAIDKAEGRVQ